MAGLENRAASRKQLLTGARVSAAPIVTAAN